MDCHLILEERVKGSYKEDGSGNNFLFELLGVKSIAVVQGGSDMMAEMTKTRTPRRNVFIMEGLRAGPNRLF